MKSTTIAAAALPSVEPTSKKPKSVKIRGYRSLPRAADFMNKIGTSGILEAALSRYGTSVGAIPLHLLPSCSSTPVPLRRKRKTWWRAFIEENKWLPPITGAPITWEDAPLILKLEFYHWALGTFGRVYSFSLDLRNDVEEEAKNRPNTCDWLNRRINRGLKQQLGRDVLIVCVWEEKGDHRRRLHVHGEFVITDNEVPAARESLRLAGGKWKKNRQFQADHDEDPDDGWATYMGKLLTLASPSLRKRLGRTFCTDYADCPVYARQQVAKRARELFNACRWQLLKSRKGTKH